MADLRLFPLLFFFFNNPPTPEIYTLSLHDALPIFRHRRRPRRQCAPSVSSRAPWRLWHASQPPPPLRPQSRLHFRQRSEEHTSELQSRPHLVCRLLLEKKKRISRAVHHQSHNVVPV